MMNRTKKTMPCRLEGGPFDGDDGQLTGDRLPKGLYVVACAQTWIPRAECSYRPFPNPSGRCRVDHVHWYTRRDFADADATPDRPVETYRYGRTHEGVSVFVYGDFTEDGFTEFQKQPRPIEKRTTMTDRTPIAA